MGIPHGRAQLCVHRPRSVQMFLTICTHSPCVHRLKLPPTVQPQEPALFPTSIRIYQIYTFSSSYWNSLRNQPKGFPNSPGPADKNETLFTCTVSFCFCERIKSVFILQQVLFVAEGFHSGEPINIQLFLFFHG